MQHHELWIKLFIFFAEGSRLRKRPNKLLSDAELEEIAAHLWDDSEDEFDFSDTDSLADPEYFPEEIEDGENNELNTDLPINDDDNDGRNEVGDLIENEMLPNENTCDNPEAPICQKNIREKITWRKKHLAMNEDALNFLGNSSLPNNILELETPYDFFKYLFTDSLLQTIVDQTNLYSVQKNPNKPANISMGDIQKFFGIALYMSVIKLPRTRCYWRPDIGNATIRKCMTINEFETLKSVIHFNNNENLLPREHPDYDNLFRIRPLLTELNTRCSSVPMENKLSIDEQICATKSKHHLKQYIPMKPHKWGFKLFMLCDTSGFTYNFEIYNGSTNTFTKVKPNEKDLGASANVVVRLSRVIPRNENFQLYCDNYYTSIPLFSYMAKDGIFMLGTIRRNRILNSKLTNEKEFTKKSRGTSEEYVGNFEGIDLSTVAWKDNKVVTMLSSCFGELPFHDAKRFDRKNKQVITIPCPNVIIEYNKHMGGVDMLDSHIGRYKIPIRSRKWYLRIFFHLLDIVTINAWLLFKRSKKEKNIEDDMTQWQFRLHLAETLCLFQSANDKKRGRPSTSEVELGINAKRHKGPAVHAPPKNVRMDNVGHWTKYDTARQRCKMPLCKGITHFKCEKCGVHLCLTKDKNCFYNFHIQ